MLKQETIESVLNRIHDWTKAADQKVSIFFAFQGVAITLMASNAANYFKVLIYKIPLLSIILFGAAIFLMIYASFKSLLSLYPRLKNKLSGKSLIYFSDIAKYSLDDYKIKIKAVNGDDYMDDLINQIHVSSVIAKNKYDHFRGSLLLSSVSIILFIISMLALYFNGN